MYKCKYKNKIAITPAPKPERVKKVLKQHPVILLPLPGITRCFLKS